MVDLILINYASGLSMKFNEDCPLFAKFGGGYPQMEKERWTRWGGQSVCKSKSYNGFEA